MEGRFFMVKAFPGKEMIIYFSVSNKPDIHVTQKGMMKTRSAEEFLHFYPVLKVFFDIAEKWENTTVNEEFYSLIREACEKNNLRYNDKDEAIYVIY